MIKKIECETCKHNIKCSVSSKCLVVAPFLIYNIINGERWYSEYYYYYYLWELKETYKDCYLPEDLFEI